MYVNGIPFFVTVSRHIKFGTIEPLVNQKQGVLVNAMKAVTQVYQGARFLVTQALMDGEFEPICGNLEDCGIVLSTTARDEHMREADQYIRTIKEMMRGIYKWFSNLAVPAIFFSGSHIFLFLRSDWPVLPVTSRKIPCVPARKSLPLPVKLDLSFCR